MKPILSLLLVLVIVVLAGCQKPVKQNDEEEEIKAGAGQKRTAVELKKDFENS